jgi:thiamine biosynthesis protein ThiS
MKTLINGKPVDVAAGATLSDLVAQLELDPRGIAIAVNETVVARSRYTDHALAEDDRIEVIHAVAGG